ncbi:hypothetical protein HJB80_02910 [Rhizobium lentis]|uniref:hypothetical protein n=1 Tax=Rhizobium lentis TaxID=1138194 RepID=UPI001C83E785|nr:hypothetical protein [Rhizobium lentis]MBX5131643.1 hypothetical protein [Rhizobium lentis]
MSIETRFHVEQITRHQSDYRHMICVLHPDGRSEWFFGWEDVDAMTGPDFTTDRDMAVKYDLTFHREEVLADYERLCEMGFDASIETVGRVSRLVEEASAYADVFKPRAGLLGLIVRGAKADDCLSASLVAAE